jgi:hypothetical protein
VPDCRSVNSFSFSSTAQEEYDQSVQSEWAVLLHQDSRDPGAFNLATGEWEDSQRIRKLKRRHYWVTSYGGCGSKMLAALLLDNSASTTASVLHVHDRFPPEHLYVPPISQKAKWRIDARERSFLGGHKFANASRGTCVTKRKDHESLHRVAFLVKDPVEALISRFGYDHCRHIQVRLPFPSLSADLKDTL